MYAKGKPALRQEKPKKKGEEAFVNNCIHFEQSGGRRNDVINEKQKGHLRNRKKESILHHSHHTRLHWHWELRGCRKQKGKFLWMSEFFHLLYHLIGSYSHTTSCLLDLDSRAGID
jgi:hypothetical protein